MWHGRGNSGGSWPQLPSAAPLIVNCILKFKSSFFYLLNYSFISHIIFFLNTRSKLIQKYTFRQAVFIVYFCKISVLFIFILRTVTTYRCVLKYTKVIVYELWTFLVSAAGLNMFQTKKLFLGGQTFTFFLENIFLFKVIFPLFCKSGSTLISSLKSSFQNFQFALGFRSDWNQFSYLCLGYVNN